MDDHKTELEKINNAEMMRFTVCANSAARCFAIMHDMCQNSGEMYLAHVMLGEIMRKTMPLTNNEELTLCNGISAFDIIKLKEKYGLK